MHFSYLLLVILTFGESQDLKRAGVTIEKIKEGRFSKKSRLVSYNKNSTLQVSWDDVTFYPFFSRLFSESCQCETKKLSLMENNFLSLTINSFVCFLQRPGVRIFHFEPFRRGRLDTCALSSTRNRPCSLGDILQQGEASLFLMISSSSPFLSLLSLSGQWELGMRLPLFFQLS